MFNRPYSAEFYSSGKAKKVEMHEIAAVLNNNNRNYFVIRTDAIKEFPPEIASKLNQVTQYSAYTLFSQTNWLEKPHPPSQLDYGRRPWLDREPYLRLG